MRLVKSTSAGTTHFEYDVNGQLLSEQDPGHGQRERDYVWAGSTPVAQIDGGRSAKHHPSKSWLPRTLLGFLPEDNADHEGEDGHEGNRDHIYYLHTDAMGTPRLATNDKQQVVWRWNTDAFGVAGQVTGQDPDDRHDHDRRDHDRHDRDRHEHGDDAHPIQMNLRYPGQYYDQETGLFYNYFRYYDPSTGRYGRSDPIGLSGGVNTYGYVGGNPLRFTDFMGLESPTISLMGLIPSQVMTQGPVANISIGAGGFGNFGILGGAADSGFAGDTEGHMCFYTNRCTAVGWNTPVGGSIGFVGQVGTGELCSGTHKSKGMYFYGGSGAGGEGQAMTGGGGVSYGRGIVGLSGGAGGGAIQCTTTYYCISY